MPYNPKDQIMPSSIPFATINAYNPYAQTPLTGTSNTAIQTPAITSGGNNAGQMSQGANDYAQVYQQRVDSIKANPLFQLTDVKATLPASTYQYTPMTMPSYSYDGNKSFGDQQGAIQNYGNAQRQQLIDTYAANDAMLNSELARVNKSYQNQDQALVQDVTGNEQTLGTNYKSARDFNKQWYTDQNLNLGNRLSAANMLDSSANDASMSGSARNKVVTDYYKREGSAYDTYNQGMTKLGDFYTTNHQKIMDSLTAEQEKIANNRTLNAREKDTKLALLENDILGKLNELKSAYDSAKAQAAAKAASRYTPTDYNQFVPTNNGTILGKEDFKPIGVAAGLAANQNVSTTVNTPVGQYPASMDSTGKLVITDGPYAGYTKEEAYAAYNDQNAREQAR